jgi:hypothetical protein
LRRLAPPQSSSQVGAEWATGLFGPCIVHGCESCRPGVLRLVFGSGSLLMGRCTLCVFPAAAAAKERVLIDCWGRQAFPLPFSQFGCVFHTPVPCPAPQTCTGCSR